MLINNSTFYTQNINILKILAPDVETPGAFLPGGNQQNH